MKRKFLLVFLLTLFASLFAENNMVFVKGGEMILGRENYKRNQPHKVVLSSFYIDKYLVKMGDFKEFLADTKLDFYWDGRITSNYLTIKEAVPSDNCPAQGMTWLYAVLYCNWLSEKEGLTPCYEFPNGLGDSKLYRNMVWNHKANGYRLPTEAEWEYAARGGQLSKGYKYPGSNDLSEVNKESHVSYEIGQMKPNELGIYDMGGLVSEYCYDWYDEKMWEWLPEKDPCFEKLEMMKEEDLPKPYRGISQLSKVYKGADREDFYDASSFNNFSMLLTNSSTIGIRLVRNNIENKEDTEKSILQIDYSELNEKKSRTVNLVITTDGTIYADGKDTGKKLVRNTVKTGKINDFRVRCRSEANLQCETLFLLEKNQKVKIIEKSKKTTLIDGESWYWYKVELPDGKSGWVYGKYLDIEE